MDQVGHQTLQILNQFIKPRVLRKVTHLLLSVSLFSFFFSYPSWPSFLLRSFNFYFSTFPLQLLNLTTDRNCIFLLCNGILVFLARSSGLISSPLSGTDYTEEFFKNNGGYSPSGSLISEMNATLLDIKLVVDSTGSLENVAVEEGRENEYLVEEQEVESAKLIVEDEQVAEYELLITDETGLVIIEDGNEEKESGSGFFYEEEEGDDLLLSAEQLNKKFDDFIRRMKEEIRIGAQQQLVMV